MGGRGSVSGIGKSKISLPKLKERAEKLTEKAENYYKQTARAALDQSGDKYEKYSNSERNRIRKKWMGYVQEARKAENEYYEERKKRRKKENNNKTFVNGYGEATRRYITSGTYERAKKRSQKEVEDFLGIRKKRKRKGI